MRSSPLLAFGLIIAIASGGYAFADPQPLTRADCDKASMTWDDTGNVCVANKDRADGNAAASEAKPQGETADEAKTGEGPSTKADNGEKKKGKKAKYGKGDKKVVKKVHGNTVIKKVTTRKGTTVTITTKDKKEQRKLFKWLKRQDQKQ